VLETILEQTLKLVAAQDAHVFLYDGQQLTFGAALWADGAHNVPYSVPRENGVTYAVARTGQRLVVPNVNHHRSFPTGNGAAPLWACRCGWASVCAG
jgi:hypothetical protein